MDIKLKYVVLIVLVTVLVCLAVVLALNFTLPDLPSTTQNDKICLPGEHGVLKCDKTTNLLHAYLERTISIKYDEIRTQDIARQQEYLDKNKDRLMKMYDGEFWEMKPAAKVIGKKQTKPQNGDADIDMTPIREWRHGRELYNTSGFERYGIRYRNGRLVVPVAGTYYIYSHVDLFVQCEPSTGKPKVEDARTPIKHGIYKYNICDEAEMELISGVQSHQISTNRYFSSYSSYISSLSFLKAGDEISVKVSNITFLKYTKDNYFGLHLV